MTLWYRFCRFLFWLYFRIYHRGKIIGAKQTPQQGGVILAGNHFSFLDPPFFGQACPREAYYMARDTLFRHPLAGAILRSWNCVPLNRDRGDIGALRTVLRMLGEGKVVLMFPEGTRSLDGKLQEGRAGIGMIVARAKVPVVPMRIFGTDRALPKGTSIPRPVRIVIRYGEPFHYPFPANMDELRGDELKAVYLDISREIMRRIGELTPEG
jgi:1-acyl-sn-glycerol-3-phosphate acyltransferase